MMREIGVLVEGGDGRLDEVAYQRTVRHAAGRRLRPGDLVGGRKVPSPHVITEAALAE